MLVCNCGWKGSNLIPHNNGTSRCPNCSQVFQGIPAIKAIYDMESAEWILSTRPNMRKSTHSWFFAWNHYNYFKKYYDDVRRQKIKLNPKILKPLNDALSSIEDSSKRMEYIDNLLEKIENDYE